MYLHKKRCVSVRAGTSAREHIRVPTSTRAALLELLVSARKRLRARASSHEQVVHLASAKKVAMHGPELNTDSLLARPHTCEFDSMMYYIVCAPCMRMCACDEI